MPSKKYTTVEEYMAELTGENRSRLEAFRGMVKKVVPEAKEVISYNMPAFRLDKIVVWYAANKEHIGLYPSVSPIEAFRDDLKKYKTSKGAIQFPYSEPVPDKLVEKIVRYRVKEIEEAKATGKKSK